MICVYWEGDEDEKNINSIGLSKAWHSRSRHCQTEEDRNAPCLPSSRCQAWMAKLTGRKRKKHPQGRREAGIGEVMTDSECKPNEVARALLWLIQFANDSDVLDNAGKIVLEARKHGLVTSAEFEEMVANGRKKRAEVCKGSR